MLHLAEALPIDLEAGVELGEKLLSRKRLHDLRHGSVSIQIAQGVDITLVSKRLGHASPAITGRLYAHLLRSAGQEVAQTAANAVPRRVVRPTRPHPGHNDQQP
ncbi:tyrosine-type recombinase/integrase [Frankia gtarii]|uniref:tyrosine-type recombinase/integrase n=1 Tax=Frankia gtarii TaxID=2950102 RepID=UPI0021C1EBDA|nr:tyrosine-type recombinase/integrase [Frankia gtarii]